jgi:hypothetical protein
MNLLVNLEPKGMVEASLLVIDLTNLKRKVYKMASWAQPSALESTLPF